VKSPSNSLRLSSPALKPPPPNLRLPLQSPCPLSPPQSLCPLPPPKSLCPLPPLQSLRSLPLSLPQTRISDCVNRNTLQLMFKKYQNSAQNLALTTVTRGCCPRSAPPHNNHKQRTRNTMHASLTRRGSGTSTRTTNGASLPYRLRIRSGLSSAPLPVTFIHFPSPLTPAFALRF
jgi:hypothetical protein